MKLCPHCKEGYLELIEHHIGKYDFYACDKCDSTYVPFDPQLIDSKPSAKTLLQKIFSWFSNE